eukprot:TRINITY_DN18149_c0_g1_i1.p1 TRINITY_DN18149_c0_g1~~TRINITY_DN18149_c0_g1_i1.p1  ORF type:complete len:725 (-),score=106.91 TRINITY_DN18149_c0_g1_i1:286-2460(-)
MIHPLQIPPAPAWAQQWFSGVGAVGTSTSPTSRPKPRAALLLPRSSPTSNLLGVPASSSAPSSPGRAASSCPASSADSPQGSADSSCSVSPAGTPGPPTRSTSCASPARAAVTLDAKTSNHALIAGSLLVAGATAPGRSSPSVDADAAETRCSWAIVRGSPSGDVDVAESKESAPKLDTEQQASGSRSKKNQNNSLQELLQLWQGQRHSPEALSEEERQCIEGVVFNSMPADRVKIVSVRRLAPSVLLDRFCAEEQESLDGEQFRQRKHKEFMLLHGTRWEYAPLIEENGLDPNCGHLTKGTWLGGLAEKAHSYAIKGPGPQQADGTRLFALFAVACVPNIRDGDCERSFGVWRMQDSRRMCPAYAIVYSAPMNIKGSQPPEPRMNKLTMARLRSTSPQHKLDLSPSPITRQRSWDESFSRTSPSLEVCRPASPRDKEANLIDCPWRPRSSDPSHEGACTQPALKVCTASPKDKEAVPIDPPFRPKSADPSCAQSALKVHQESCQATSPKVTRRTSNGWKSPSSGMSKNTQKRSTGHAVNDEIKRRSSQCETGWEVLLDDKWIPFRSATKLRDNPGTEQNIVQGQFWYALKFEADGMSGSQKNISTGKVRPLRRVQERESQVDEQQPSIPEVQQASQPAGQNCNEAAISGEPRLKILMVSGKDCQSQTTAGAPPSTKSPAEGLRAPRIIVQAPSKVCTTIHSQRPRLSAWYPNLLGAASPPTQL